MGFERGGGVKFWVSPLTCIVALTTLPCECVINGNWTIVKDFPRPGMGIKSREWEGMGTRKSFLHIRHKSCWPAAAGGSLEVTQKATIFGLGQTGHLEGATDYHRRPSVHFVSLVLACGTVCRHRRRMHLLYLPGCWNANFFIAVTSLTCANLGLSEVCLYPATVSWTY